MGGEGREREVEGKEEGKGGKGREGGRDGGREEGRDGREGYFGTKSTLARTYMYKGIDFGDTFFFVVKAEVTFL